jgi:predicted aminopeptidase
MKERPITHHSSPVTHRAAAARWLVAACAALLLGSCTNLTYYMQSVMGQLDMWRRERAIDEVIADPATPEALTRRLQRVLEIRAFATRELGLPESDSYGRYADLQRPFVVWNVFAAPEFSVRPEQWCFPVVGCVSYRGYFERGDAARFAAELAAEGYDVYIGPVPAFSTLGWFPDPVLNTFINYPEAELARLVFHELSHQLLYVRDDTAFNESFAVTVEQEGVRRWLAYNGYEEQHAEFERRRGIRIAFARLVRKYRERLDALYRSPLEPAVMRARKAELLRQLEEEYRQVKQAEWGGFAGFDAWFARKPNNAQLTSVAIYTQMVPAFRELLRREDNDLERFYAAVRRLGRLPKEQRYARLVELAPQLARQPLPTGEQKTRGAGDASTGRVISPSGPGPRGER